MKVVTVIVTKPQTIITSPLKDNNKHLHEQ